jgi:dTDP-glucose pyrophosphorylase/CBS domain-containing protein
MLNKKLLIPKSYTIREAMVRLNDLGIINADIFVTDNDGNLLGSLSDGDIRRAIIKGVQPSNSVKDAMNSNCIYFEGSQPDKETINRCKRKKIRFLPLVSKEKQITRIIDIDQIVGIVPVEAIIIAGGEGKRLRPLTNKLPKPLLPIGGKPIIEHNIDRLTKYGITHIQISINYLGHMLQEYFEDGSKKNIHISYILEDKPMGTIGAVTAVDNWNTDHILIMNSDILTDLDYDDFYNDFTLADADLAVAAIPYKVSIPYAVMETESENTKEIKALAEKPTYTYYSNAGIYLLKREVLDYIPKNCHYDMTDLIQMLINHNKKVISYPIRTYWLDIGKMDDYEKAQEDIKHLKI